ncbi:hypothetical protein EK904_006776 [Melospiza melodia maxima]|nr:hypothetical protein EK904_006776 [Melospiza melodia maxima]
MVKLNVVQSPGSCTRQDPISDPSVSVSCQSPLRAVHVYTQKEVLLPFPASPPPGKKRHIITQLVFVFSSKRCQCPQQCDIRYSRSMQAALTAQLITWCHSDMQDSIHTDKSLMKHQDVSVARGTIDFAMNLEMQLMAQQFAMTTPDNQKEQNTSAQSRQMPCKNYETKVNFWRFKWDTKRQVETLLTTISSNSYTLHLDL